MLTSDTTTVFHAHESQAGEKTPLPTVMDMDGDQNSTEEVIDSDIFSEYVCSSLNSLPLPFDTDSGEILEPKPHPGSIAESSLLANIPLPSIDYPVDVFHKAIKDGSLSSLQLEGILSASQAHQHILPDGKRAGFLLGDGTGVGKGRQIAGVILDNYARGRKQSVWLSVSSDLRIDAERDLNEVGCHLRIIDGCIGLSASQSKGLGMSKGDKEGIMFSTYSTLISSTRGAFEGGSSSVSSKAQSRLQQIVDWCGGHEFEGLLVFDEAHKAKNHDVAKEENSTKVARAVIAIQDAMPRARVLYASASAVTEVSQLAYCNRLGLWGVGTPFMSFKAFASNMEKRGLGALEMLAMEMKARGSYVSRGLSWIGAEFELHEYELLPEDETMYEGACHFFQKLRYELEMAIEITGAEGMCTKDVCRNGHMCNPMRQYWACLQRFFKDLATAVKVPFVVRQALEAEELGHAVIIGLQSTGESGMEKMMEELKKKPGDSVLSFMSSGREGVSSFIKTFFPVLMKSRGPLITITSEDCIDQELRKLQNAGDGTSGYTRTGSGLDSGCELHLCSRDAQMRNYSATDKMHIVKPEEVSECLAAQNALLASIDTLNLPPSALDSLIDGLGGPSRVAEMTGRKCRICHNAKGFLQYESRYSGTRAEASLNNTERAAFMSGKKPFAIISDAASTGISLHAASGSATASRRRIHITLELAWSADKTIQQLGRSHRSHQVTAPIYRLVVTNLGGERRFASAVAKRLFSLGALTKGDRRGASGLDFGTFDIDNKYGSMALQELLNATLERKELAKGVKFSHLCSSIPPALSELFQHGEKETIRNELLLGMIRDAIEIMCLDMRPQSTYKVSTFLTRLQSLAPSLQRLIFVYFSYCMETIMAGARASGTLDTGVVDIVAPSIQLKGVEKVALDEKSGSVTNIIRIEIDRGVDWDRALAKYEKGLNMVGEGDDNSTTASDKALFFRSKQAQVGKKKPNYLLAVRKRFSNNSFVVTRPSTGTSPFEKSGEDLFHVYTRLDMKDEHHVEELRREWTSAFLESDNDDRGGRKLSVVLLSGVVLPLWPALEQTVTQCRAHMTKAEQVVGVRFPEKVLHTLQKNISNLTAHHATTTDVNGFGVSTPTTERFTKEIVSPIIPQALRKATTAPNTITNYFSSVIKNKEERQLTTNSGNDIKGSHALWKDHLTSTSPQVSSIEESRKRRKIHGKCDFQVQNFDKRKKDDKWRSQPSSQANSIVIDLT